MTAISRTALLPYSTAQMYELVADIPSYPQFLPWCAGARVLARTPEAVVAAIDIRYGGVRKTFTTRNLLRKNEAMEMRLIDGPFRYLHGHWRFQDLDDAVCKISFDLEFEVANRTLGLVLGPVFTKIASQMVQSFQHRADDIYRVEQ